MMYHTNLLKQKKNEKNIQKLKFLMRKHLEWIIITKWTIIMWVGFDSNTHTYPYRKTKSKTHIKEHYYYYYYYKTLLLL